MSFLPAEIIKSKRDGLALSDSDIQTFISGYTCGEIPDYQMSALLMAIFFKGMNKEETLALTKSMLNSGEVVSFPDVPEFKVDKHSTGGVGDKTSLILGPMVAALGIPVPMISGRGLGHTGGTLDKLESIPGFNTQLDLPTFKKAIKDHRICFIGQTKEICPADKKIYALRDVTATVESLPLICASIMSKKLAEGIDGLVLDVKFGTGAFMKTVEAAEKLARSLMSIGQGYGKKVSAFLTNMNQPLGAFAGNACEIHECVQILRNEFPQDLTQKRYYFETRDLSVELAAEMAFLAGYGSKEACRDACAKTLVDGTAFEKFQVLCKIHGGQLSSLPKPKYEKLITATKDGFVEAMNTEKIGIAGLLLKAGRAKTTDIIEPTAGIQFFKKTGESIKAGEALFKIFGADQNLFATAEETLQHAVVIGPQQADPIPLIYKHIPHQ
jgi:pyrimidine-nucleoside phosphorylase